MATFILAILTATTTIIIYSLGYVTAEYKNWLKNQNLYNEKETNKPE